MTERAEVVSATLTTNRNCTVEISNFSSYYFLINPKVYMTSGFCHHPPQPTVQYSRTDVCSFTKDDNTATGAVGVLTYDLFHMQSRVGAERLAIMFSVPYDQNLYNNRLAIGLFDPLSNECDKKLYDLMYDAKPTEKFVRSDGNGSGLEHQSQAVDIRGTMSSIGKAIVKVELYDKLLN